MAGPDPATTEPPWVGRSILRVEDDALLRGEGRFLDDLAPVARTFHAAIVRSQLAHARIEVDATAALALARRRRRPHRRGRGATVAPVPGRDRVGHAAVRGRDRHRALRRRADRRRRGPRPLPRRGRRRARRGRLRPARRGARPGGGSSADAVHDRTFSYGDVDEAMAGAELVVRETFRFPRFTCTPVECYAVVADWDATAGRLTAWANFQGPFTLHGVAAAALGLPGDRLRLLTPPDSGGSFGIKSSVFAYVVLMGLAARQLGVPVSWTEDRLEHLAASAAATGRVRRRSRPGSPPTGSCSRSATTRSRTSARTSGRRSRRPSTACTARSRARTACRTSPSGTASCSRTRSPRVSTVASAARSSTSGWSGRWRSPPDASASIPPSSRGET